ncbi:type II toxin-antitoxin system VapC family toxin [Roseiarcaceae bacterium H3SJ34-1]|uniref:hypothetical protein n=1 Tax=Terripilifer ovatus TaxID=3032367 RepID=UPI003AB93846|nr:type II toxin-antitoxin system VapC family toxin [Roseiarcaceae bacterium H3SJ34-1]
MALIVDAFVEDLGAEEMIISPEIGKQALTASATYGKSVEHVADLNFGDCFSYACAKVLGVALLYKGDDFGIPILLSMIAGSGSKTEMN